MAIEKDFFRQVMGRFTTGVTVVTTEHQGQPGGLTVNAFCSVSLNPPLVLVCVDLGSQTLPLIRASKSFAVNMLSNQQEALSRCFATRSSDRFDHFCNATHYKAVTGAPILDGVLAFIDARVVAEYPGGDHAIFIGQVVAMGIGHQVIFADDADQEQSTIPEASSNGRGDHTLPLVYYRAQYRHLAEAYREPSLTASTRYDEDSK